ncbi:MAG TPA: hypothetical protein VIM63_12115, partial [Rhodoferax sp.]
MLTHLNSSLLPVEQFRADLHSTCGSFQVQPSPGRELLRGAVALETRGGFEFAHVATDAQFIHRNRRNIARDDAEHFFLIIQEEGQALMSQSDSTRTMRPGDLMLIDSAEPSEFTFFGSYSRQLSVHLPRRELHNRFGNALRGGLFVPRTDHTALAIFAVLAKAFEPSNNAVQTSYLGEAMYGLLGSMLYACATPPHGIDADTRNAHLLERATSYIEAHHANGDFRIEKMATDLKVSSRQLQRAFATLDTTPTEFLLRRRLTHACQALKQKRATGQKVLVSTIAFNT